MPPENVSLESLENQSTPATPSETPQQPSVSTDETSPNRDADLRSTLADALRQHTSEDGTSPVPTFENEPQEQPQSEEQTSGERPRDEKGRFVSQGQDGEQPPAQRQTDVPPEEGQEIDDPTGEADEPVEPPVDWDLQDQETFRKLSPDQQRWVVGRENAALDKAEEVAENVINQRYGWLENELGRRQQQFAIQGLTPQTAISQLFTLSDYAAQDPAGFIQYFANQRGIDLSQLAGQPQQPQPQIDPNDPNAQVPPQNGEIPRDPYTMQLENHVKQLTNAFNQLKGQIDQRTQAEIQRDNERMDAEINAFVTAQDENGQLKHPYYEQVRPLMATLLERHQASTMEQAYDMACRANSDVNAKIAAAQKHADERARVNAERKKAAAAQKAGSSVSGSPASRAQPSPQGSSIRDLIRQNLRDNSGGVMDI